MASESNKSTVLTIFGTRPEAIKLAPVILELRKRSIPQTICVTGQQREMLDQMTALFGIKPDFDLNIMQDRQTLEDITTNALRGLQSVLEEVKPALVVVQGDTTTVFSGALAAFYHKVPVAHVEAGLRTDSKYNPYPEEMNRRLTSQLTDLHFAPTGKARQNLQASGVPADSVFVTGNTVIDALLWVIAQDKPYENILLRDFDFSGKRTVLLTTHRRENLGEGMDGIFSAINRLTAEYADLQIVFPVHLNPAIREHVQKSLASNHQVLMTEPLEYSDLARLMKESYLVMTDSGGIQEEAPALGKPVLVLRTTTERPEGIEAGTAKLVGVTEATIYESAHELLDSEAAYQAMAKAVNPYGDGHAASQIVDHISEYLKSNGQ